jgi:two-component system, response regulator / RNA-binding antiterminator
MRVWLIDDKQAGSPSALEELLRRLQDQLDTGLRLLGSSAFQPNLAASLRKLVPDLLDVIIINERACPDGPWIEEVLDLGLGVVLLTDAKHGERFRALADSHALTFVPAPASAEAVWLSLLTCQAAGRREARWRKEFAHLHQRLADRIVIERAKGILIQRLGISEEEAYKRLRVLSRRQRRQIRDIAQSLLDTEQLFTPEVNGAVVTEEAKKEETPKS